MQCDGLKAILAAPGYERSGDCSSETLAPMWWFHVNVENPSTFRLEVQGTSRPVRDNDASTSHNFTGDFGEQANYVPLFKATSK